MKDEKVSGASSDLVISGKEFEAYPLSDKELDSLTQWCRYKLQKDARTQADFAESASEVEEIKETAFRKSLNVKWFDEVGVNLLLNDAAGLIEVAYRMTGKEWKKDWFENRFGSVSDYTTEQLRNRHNVQHIFLEQNTIGEPRDKKPQNNTKEKSKKN